MVNIMKPYKEVIKDRYNNKKNINIYDNIYSLINPVGFYLNQKIRYIFYKIFNIIRKNDIDITKSNILDIGCGDGTWTRFFAELKGTPSGIYGVDLSNNRIKEAKTLNPNIKYLLGNITNITIKDIKFDIITAIDVFSHLSTEEEILKSLNNIYNLLTKNGMFLWYDIHNRSHFKARYNCDAYGYNKNEIIKFCKKVGFKKIYYSKIFKKIFWKYHSAYIVNKNIHFWIISLLEKILPGSAGNLIFLFKKL